MVEPAQLGFGLVALVIGAIFAGLPRATAGAFEIVDTIGSTTNPSDVEPAGWSIALTRITGIALLLYGLLVVGQAL